jgi:hypothetical protein
VGWHLAVHCTQYMHTILVLHFTPVIYICAVTVLEKKISTEKPEIQSEQWNSTDV